MNIYSFLSAIFTGILSSLSIIPTLSNLIWLALVPLLLIRTNGWFQVLISGYLAGSILFATISFGVIPENPVGFLFYTFIASLFFAIFMLFWNWIKRSATNEFLLLFFPPLLWTSLEYIFLNLFSIPFTISLVLYQKPQFLQSARYTGIYGVSFLIILVNSTIAMISRFMWEKLIVKKTILRESYVFSGVGIVAFIFLLNLGLSFMSSSERNNSEGIKISALQGNINPDEYNLADILPTKAKEIQDKYFNLILEAAKDKPDIIVLPEGTTTNFNFRISRLQDKIYHLANKTNSYLLFGSLDLDTEGKVYNSIFVVSPKGKLIDRYDKVKLVPFGEGIVNKGNDCKVIPTPIAALGHLICWESVFPAMARKLVRRGAEILFIHTNDGDFRVSSLPILHSAEAVFRAIETNRYVARAANFGISMITNPKGRIIKQIDLNKEGIIYARVERNKSQTVYTKIGDIFSLICVLLTLLFWGAIVCRRKQKIISNPIVENKSLRYHILGFVSSQILIIVLVVISGVIITGSFVSPSLNWGKHLSNFFIPSRPPLEVVETEFLQAKSNTCGHSALSYLLNLWGYGISEREMSKLVRIRKEGVSMYDLAQAAKKLGFNAWGERQNFKALKETRPPVIAFINSNHYVVILEIDKGFVILFDPSLGHIRVEERIFRQIWTGYCLIVRTKPIMG